MKDKNELKKMGNNVCEFNKELNDLNDEDLEQIFGGRLNKQTRDWIMYRRFEIRDRAIAKNNYKEVLDLISHMTKYPKKYTYSLEEFKLRLSDYIEVKDL